METAVQASFFQLNDQNALFNEGKSSFYEKLNQESDVPTDVFEKQREGAFVTPKGRGLGAVLPAEEEWFTHSELEELYSKIDRQSLPAFYDARSLGKILIHMFPIRALLF